MRCIGVSYVLELFFFFKQKTAYEMRISDWSSDVCSSDLQYSGRYGDLPFLGQGHQPRQRIERRCQRGLSCGGTRSEEHTSELQSLMRTSYAVFCLKKKKDKKSLELGTSIMYEYNYNKT